MTTVTLLCETEVDLAKVSDSDFRDELRRRTLIMEDIKEDVRQDVLDALSPSDFATEDLLNEIERRKVTHDHWTDRVYRLLAEGDSAGAMDIMHRELDLAPPSHECAIADLISGRKGPAHV